MLAQFWKSGGHVKPSGLQVGLLEANMGPKEAFIGGPKFGNTVPAWFVLVVFGLHRGVGGYNTKPLTHNGLYLSHASCPHKGGWRILYYIIYIL